MCVKNGAAENGSGIRCGSGNIFVHTVFFIFYFDTGAGTSVAALEQHHGFFL
jgi:hypothetical protein